MKFALLLNQWKISLIELMTTSNLNQIYLYDFFLTLKMIDRYSFMYHTDANRKNKIDGIHQMSANWFMPIWLKHRFQLPKFFAKNGHIISPWDTLYMITFCRIKTIITIHNLFSDLSNCNLKKFDQWSSAQLCHVYLQYLTVNKICRFILLIDILPTSVNICQYLR